GEQIGHGLDDADHPPVALRVAADGTRILRRQVATRRAETDLLAQRQQRLGELARVFGRALQHVERQPLRRLLSDARQLREQHGEAGDRIGHFGKPGIIPPSAESGFSAAAASCAALSAEFTAANTKSSSMGTSRGSTACLSICTFWISPLPLALTITIPPPLEPVTVLRANRSCASRICSWSCCACSKSAFKSNPGMPYSSPRSRTSSISPPRTSTAARTAGCSRARAIRLSDAAARSFCFCSATEVSAGASCSTICSGTRKPSAFSNAASTAGRASCTIAACPAPLRKAICTPPRSIFKGMACSSAAAAPALRAARTESIRERQRPCRSGSGSAAGGGVGAARSSAVSGGRTRAPLRSGAGFEAGAPRPRASSFATNAAQRRRSIARENGADDVPYHRGVQSPERLGRFPVADLAGGGIVRGEELIEQREGVAHRPLRLSRHQRHRAVGDADFLGLRDLAQPRGDLAEWHELDVVPLHPGEDGGRKLLRIGCREQELDVAGRLLERLEQRIERRAGEHVHFVDDVDLVAVAGRQVLRRLAQRPHVVD